ncbi:MAG: CDGSH iron-sulfur domain-containing protein [Chloroflexi bacterium]|nr:CDGSH iron-sulfur domain-containing protein [Chloroflexota bacterium]
MSEQKDDKPTIEPTVNGPYRVTNLTDFKNSRGETIPTEPEMYLCRCGGSSHKPFCDGTHLKNDFNGDKSPGRVPDKMDDYVGQEITIHDNRGVCAHSGFCTDNSPTVFNMGHEPWIDPDGADTEETAQTIRLCPSGALSYTKDGVLYQDQNRSPAVTIAKDGPHRVDGGIELQDPTGSKPESKEHYSLCRCGGSKNKPFCDGAHWHIGFKDNKN